jgi:predicted DsbA family dithiol-disulfide isomerase
MNDESTLRIDVVSDVVCPWCYIGSERLEKVIASLGLTDRVEVTYHPYLLRPDTPATGADIHEELRRKYGADPQRLFARVEAAARESDIELDLSKQRFTYPTVAAHTLLRHAKAKGTQRALAKALFEAHFVDALNVADPDVLERIGTVHGFTPDEVHALLHDPRELEQTRREAQQATRSGVDGVPFFSFGGQKAVAGAQPERVLEQVLRELIGAAR